MKSKMKRRMLAIVLCMVIALSNSSFIFASSGTEEPAAVAQEGDPQNVQEAQTEAAVQDTPAVLSETTPEATPEATPEPTQVPEVTAAPTEAPQATEEPTQAPEVTAAPETTPEATPVPTETPVVTAEPTQAPEITPTPAPEVTEAPEATPEATPVPSETPENSDALIDHETDEQTISPVFEGSFEVEDGSAVVYAKAPEGVFPEGTTFTARRIEAETDEYQTVEESLENEAAKTEKDVLDFVAYDITFSDAEGNEIEPNGNVQVSIDFNNMEFGGIAEENASVDVVHIKDDFTTETIQSDIDTKDEQLNKVEFSAEQFSIYAVTTTGIIERYNSNIQANDYAVIEFWDKDTSGGNQDIIFEDYSKSNYSNNSRYLKINVYLEGITKFSKTFVLDMEDDEYKKVSLQTTVKPGEGYYLSKECVWTKAGADGDDDIVKFGGSGSTWMNNASQAPKVNTLEIYLTKNKDDACSQSVSATTTTKNISVDLYNYDTEAYNSSVGLTSSSLLLRSAWGNYKADGYGITGGDNKHNESCGKTGIYYGLVESELQDDNIVFTKTAKFFDNGFDSSVGTKYSDVDFEFIYDEDTKEYKYSSEDKHVHFDEGTNKISQYVGKGPNILSDSTSLERYGFFPFTDEEDNMIDYGFGMRMDVEFQLTEDGTIDGTTPMTFSFSGDDDVWVFIDDQLVLDLGGLHSRRGGTINFKNHSVTYDKVQDENGIDVEPTAVSGQKPDTSFLEGLEAGTHTLTMYYLERGGNESNCEIKFNLLVVNREGTLEFEKVDDSGKGLSGAQFGIYSTKQISESDEPILTASSGENGKVSFDISHMTEGTYYLKEISAPFGYISDNAVYSVIITEDKSNPTSIRVSGNIQGLENGKLVNEKYTASGGETNVTVKKEWEDNLTPEPVSVTLWANGVRLDDPEYTVILNETNSWTKTWEDLPGDTVYEVKENDIPAYTEVTTEESVDYTISGVPYRITPCNVFSYTLAENAVVIIFRNSEYHVWTPVEISDRNSFYSVLNAIKGNSGPAIRDNNTQFYTGKDVDAGFQNTDDIHFTYNDETRQINVDYVASNAWSWFCIGNYNKNATITLTNGIDENATIDIPVEKKWMGNPQFTDYRTYVTVELYQNGNKYSSAQIKQEDNWKYIFEDIPYFYWDSSSSSYKTYEYTIKEINIAGDPIYDANWVVDITGNANEGFVITNIWIPHWYIYKVSSTDNRLPLGGAKFVLTKDGEEIPSYYGMSLDYGRVVWWKNEQDLGDISKMEKYIPDGIYILKETEAPKGYEKNDVTWTITINDLEFATIIDSNGNTINPYDPMEDVPSTRGAVRENIYLYENTPITYNLPSAGGSGIFWYLISGTAFMMAASLILYRMKRKEVLGK